MQYSFISVDDIIFSGLSFWQSKIWANILKNSWQAQDVYYYWNTDSTYFLVEIRSIGAGLSGAFILGVTSSQIGGDVSDCLDQLKKELKKKWVLFLQIEPLDELSIPGQEIRKPYKKFLTPHTRILDLSLNEDALLAQMHEKGRYNIRTAIKRWVAIELAEVTEENIDIWMSLLSDTLSRDDFAGNSREYYVLFIRQIVSANLGWLYFARYEGRVVAAGIFVFSPERAIYYYGASSSAPLDRGVFAPYLLQWEAIKIARSRGIPIYDFLGISNPDNSNDVLAGVSFFKSRFGGYIERLPRKFLFPLSWKYGFFLCLQRIKNLLKRR